MDESYTSEIITLHNNFNPNNQDSIQRLPIYVNHLDYAVNRSIYHYLRFFTNQFIQFNKLHYPFLIE